MSHSIFELEFCAGTDAENGGGTVKTTHLFNFCPLQQYHTLSRTNLKGRTWRGTSQNESRGDEHQV